MLKMKSLELRLSRILASLHHDRQARVVKVLYKGQEGSVRFGR